MLIKRDTFETYKLQKSTTPPFELEMSREQAIELILRQCNNDDIVVSTTGMPSREVFEIRARAKAGHTATSLPCGSHGPRLLDCGRHCTAEAGS